jgi:hypothetical protein
MSGMIPLSPHMSSGWRKASTVTDLRAIPRSLCQPHGLQPPAQIARARPPDFLFERRRGDIPLPLNSRCHSRLLGFDLVADSRDFDANAEPLDKSYKPNRGIIYSAARL